MNHEHMIVAWLDRELTMAASVIREAPSRESIVAFCEQRLDVMAMDKLIKSHPQGLSAPELSVSISKGDYQSVLTAIWAERDREKRHTWLRENAGLHAPLMFELAMSEATSAKCAADTIERVVIPLFIAAEMRTSQDALCHIDKGVALTHKKLVTIYMIALQRLAIKNNVKLSSTWQTGEENIFLNAQKEVIHRATLESRLPHPGWVGKYEGALSGALHPEGTCQEKRLSLASSFKSTLPEASSNSCIVCTEDIASERQPIAVLACAHTFHRDCVVTWLKEKCRCPLCRQEVCGKDFGVSDRPPSASFPDFLEQIAMEEIGLVAVVSAEARRIQALFESVGPEGRLDILQLLLHVERGRRG